MNSLFSEEELEPTKFTRAPLNFIGQKLNFLKEVLRYLSTQSIGKDVVFLDLFGGSGLLSHNIKQAYPENKVVWNDFDNYQHRLDLIDISTRKIQEFYYKNILTDIKTQLGKKMSPEQKKLFLDFISQWPKEQLDLKTLASITQFMGTKQERDITTGKYSLFMNRFFLPKSYKLYLKDVTRERMDFRGLYEKYKENELFILADPPYLETYTKCYTGDQWSFEDLSDLISIIKQHRFIYFSSSRVDHRNLLDGLDLKIKQRDMLMKHNKKASRKPNFDQMYTLRNSALKK